LGRNGPKGPILLDDDDDDVILMYVTQAFKHKAYIITNTARPLISFIRNVGDFTTIMKVRIQTFRKFSGKQ
jgi:hypothetical protein